MKKQMTDREFYPALLITLAVLAIAFLVWRYALDMPTISACWIYEHWHVYCPGCGGTRSLLALLKGNVLESFYYHPALPILVGTLSVYLVSQTFRRLRGGRGWALRYRTWWAPCMVVILVVNCLVRNILLLGFGSPIS